MKGFFKSKTVWFNLLACGWISISAAGFTSFRADPDLITVIIAIVNILLRIFTKKPLHEK